MELVREADGAGLICNASVVRLGMQKRRKRLTFFSQSWIN
jgi:hypothetical protein